MLALNLFTHVFSVVHYYGESMEPALYDRQILVVHKTDKVGSGDIVAFYYNNKVLVRRVIAEGGSSVEIEDNGKGIAQKDLPKIFERFYRTDASRNSAQGGSGIGLSIVKKIIEDHGGYIWASGKEGEGTCIHFVIRKYKEIV